MTLIADANGVVNGQFTIPPNIRAGTRSVRFRGKFGSMAAALYSASGQKIQSTTRALEITAPPKPLIAIDVAYTTKENQPLTIAANQGVLIKSSTPNGGEVFIDSYTQPESNGTQRGVISIAGSGAFSYTPPSDFSGLTICSVVIKDATDTRATLTVLIDVVEVNRPPVAVRDNWTTLMGSSVSGNVLTNDSSPDGNPLVLSGATSPGNGSVTTNAGGAITYTPSPLFYGVDTFSYTIVDTVNGLSATGQVWVHVNVPPILARNDEYNITASVAGRWVGTANLPVLTNDATNPFTTIIAVTQPAPRWGYTATISIAPGGQSLNVAVQNRVVGSPITVDGTFTYTLRDSVTGAESIASVRIFTSQYFYDPLAQTFAFESLRQIHAVDVWLSHKGTSALAIELREVVSGIPNIQPIGRGLLSLSNQTAGGWNRVSLAAPVTIQPFKNYAFVAMCDDDQAQLATAEIGKYDLDAGEWVTVQPYLVGVLLSSSNNATWTPHQNTDLAFRLVSKTFVATSKRISLGDVALSGDTDFLVSADIEIPSSGCSVEFELAMPSGATYTVSPRQPLSLSAPETGDMGVTAVLVGTETVTPVMGRDVTVLHGPISTTGTYQSRSMVAGGANNRVRCIYEAQLQAGSSVAAKLIRYQTGVGEIGQNTFPAPNTVLLDDGYVEYSHELSGMSADSVAVHLTLTGSAASRPKIRNFRAMVM